MSAQLKYYVIAAGLFLLLLLVEIYLPKPISWLRTLSSNHKIPYGTFVLKESIQKNNVLKKPMITRETFFEMKDTSENILVIANTFANGPDDFNRLLEIVSSGSTVIVAANQFGKEWDSLGISTSDYVQTQFEETGNPKTTDSLSITWGSRTYLYYVEDNRFLFEVESENWEIHAIHGSGNPVVLSRRFGEGQIIIVSNPWIFTNHYLLAGNGGIVDQLFSLLPQKDLHWTEFYSLGRSEASSPIRYILSVPSLKWAYYLLIIFLLIFIVFEAKRKQRPIPVQLPPVNETLNFVRTVANLYYERGDHKNMALKKISFLFEQIRSRYYLATNEIDRAFIQKLSNKSGKPLINVEGLITLIRIIQSKEKIDEEELLVLDRKIDSFLH